MCVLRGLAAGRLDLRRSIFIFAWMNDTYMGGLLMSLGLMPLTGYRLERVRFPKWNRTKGSGGVFAVHDWVAGANAGLENSSRPRWLIFRPEFRS